MALTDPPLRRLPEVQQRPVNVAVAQAAAHDIHEGGLRSNRSGWFGALFDWLVEARSEAEATQQQK